ncbi:MAG: DUF438 domain-containing protein, partial [Planctomycetaceae bacterium]|nr:DUF438 domain-containing protein [Planctomycetaceae bacterium]
IRADLKEVRSAAEKGDVKAFASKTPAFARDLVEMVYKEEKILFPMALQTLSDKEWTEIRKGEDELGYVLTKPAAEWPTLAQRAQSVLNVADSAVKDGLFGLMTGDISLEQLNLIMAGLPMDLSFVDENDTVRFYSEGPERIFPRSPAVIGRKVQNCHPPKSVDTVQKILNSFRAGTQNLAEFWLEIGERFIHIRYFAIRDKENRYRGCLEVSQDITRIRTLKGQRRLLEWNEN